MVVSPPSPLAAVTRSAMASTDGAGADPVAAVDGVTADGPPAVDGAVLAPPPGVHADVRIATIANGATRRRAAVLVVKFRSPLIGGDGGIRLKRWRREQPSAPARSDLLLRRSRGPGRWPGRNNADPGLCQSRAISPLAGTVRQECDRFIALAYGIRARLGARDGRSPGRDARSGGLGRIARPTG